MKRFLFGFLAILFLIFNTIPYLHILADQSMTESQLKQVGAFALSSLITTGEATELDFSDYTDSDTDFLLALGELVVTGDPSGLVGCGLDWLGGTIDDVYDSAIQSIRTWEYNNLPNSFYYWFIDENPPYELAPSYNNIRDLSQPLRRLLTPPDSDSPAPNPDLDYNSYIYTINSENPTFPFKSNGIYNNSSNQWPYWIPDGKVIDSSLYSFVWNGQSNISSSGMNYNSYTVSNLFGITDILDIYINSVDNNTYYYSITPIKKSFVSTDNGNTLAYGLRYSSSQNSYYITYFGTNFNLPTISYSGTLEQVFQHLTLYFRNINIYVNGNPWSIVGNSETTYPIVIPGQLTIWNDQPLEYTFPQDTYLKLPDLTNIITNAINNSGVVMWSDIADCFVDVNGQTAVAVTKIVRNDYDNLYMEQYPYPAMLVGMTDQTKFNEHLLDNSHAYLSPMGTVVQETVNVLPSELVCVLAIGAILTIFAVIINRLLE